MLEEDYWGKHRKAIETGFELDKGKIVDSGSFDELFNKNEQFKKMFLMENIK